MIKKAVRAGVVISPALLYLTGIALLGPPSPALGAAKEAKPPPKKAESTAKTSAQPPPKPGTPSEADKQAFMKVVADIKQKIAESPNKEKAAKEGLVKLQKYAADHAREPISDTVKLTAAHLQFQMGQTEEALAAMRQIAANPLDKQTGWAAQLSMAQVLMQTGKVDEAEKILQGIVAKNEDAELVETAKQGLAMMAVRPGQKLSAFTAKDLAGKTHTLDEYAGKVLLVDFWATWCGPCREELPNVKKVYDQFKDQGFAILGISLDHQQPTLEAYIKEQGIEWPQVFEGNQILAEQYAVVTIPRMLLVDRQGVIRYVDVRGLALEKAVTELLGSEKKGEKPDAPK
jgi:peroxiredoxin